MSTEQKKNKKRQTLLVWRRAVGGGVLSTYQKIKKQRETLLVVLFFAEALVPG